MNPSFLSPPEIAESFIETGCKKAKLPIGKQLLLGMMAGAFIALAASGSNVAIHNIGAAGLAKALAGALFSAGLMMVIIAGGELFTGNCLMIISRLERKTTWASVARNWFFVYIGNFIGAMLVAVFIIHSGQLGFSGGLLGGFTIKTAVYKTHLTLENALFMGVLCNWLVCLAVWMAAGARDIAGKALAIFFPIWLFISSGFEHSIANMYYIPAGILAKSNPTWVAQAVSLGVTQEQISALNWNTFVLNNLLPVTLGNVLGGAVLVGTVYWFAYLRKRKSIQLAQSVK